MKRINIDLKLAFGALDLTAKDKVTTKYLGQYKSIFKGRGLEFESYRPFTMDDDASMIDRLASERAGSLVVRQYSEERNMDVFFLIDSSNTMILSSQPKLKCEYAAEFVAALAHTIIQSDDNVGFAMFNDKVSIFSEPMKGPTMYSRLVETLSEADLYGGGCNIKNALEFVLGFLKQGSLLILVTDFIGLDNKWEELIRSVAGKFSLIGVMIRDPVDRQIPPGMGQIALADPLTNQNILIDPNVIKPYFDKAVKDYEDAMRHVFKDSGSDFIILQTDEPFVGKVIDLFKQRGSRWR